MDLNPGFSAEPVWLARVEDAMRLVNRDVAATGLPHQCRLRVDDDKPWLKGNAHVVTWDGYTGTGSGVSATAGADPVSALVDVAEDAQDAVVHSIWTAWPVCPVHQAGAHARDHEQAAVWWCTVEGGHVVSAIGAWPGR